jgi:hypothetical protein
VAPQINVADEVAPPKEVAQEAIAPSQDPVSLPPTENTAPRVVKKASHPALTVKPVSAPVKTARSPQPTVAPPPPVPPAVLDIEVEHKFAEAKLSIWIDNTLTYTHQLEGSDKKRMVVFHKVEGHEFHAVQIAPGKHSVRVRVEAETESYDQSSTLDGDFASGKESELKINFGKRNEMQLSLQ